MGSLVPEITEPRRPKCPFDVKFANVLSYFIIFFAIFSWLSTVCVFVCVCVCTLFARRELNGRRAPISLSSCRFIEQQKEKQNGGHGGHFGSSTSTRRDTRNTALGNVKKNKNQTKTNVGEYDETRWNLFLNKKQQNKKKRALKAFFAADVQPTTNAGSQGRRWRKWRRFWFFFWFGLVSFCFLLFCFVFPSFLDIFSPFSSSSSSSFPIGRPATAEGSCRVFLSFFLSFFLIFGGETVGFAFYGCSRRRHFRSLNFFFFYLWTFSNLDCRFSSKYRHLFVDFLLFFFRMSSSLMAPVDLYWALALDRRVSLWKMKEVVVQNKKLRNAKKMLKKKKRKRNLELGTGRRPEAMARGHDRLRAFPLIQLFSNKIFTRWRRIIRWIELLKKKKAPDTQLDAPDANQSSRLAFFFCFSLSLSLSLSSTPASFSVQWKSVDTSNTRWH